MARTVGSTDPSETIRNIHVGAPENFHRRLKVVCAKQGVKLKEYVLAALMEKVERDEKAAR